MYTHKAAGYSLNTEFPETRFYKKPQTQELDAWITAKWTENRVTIEQHVTPRKTDPSSLCSSSLDALEFLRTQNPNLSVDSFVATKALNYSKIQKVYTFDKGNSVSIKVFLEMPTYDYRLIRQLLEEVEFPLKDFFRDRLIFVEYIPVFKGNIEPKEMRLVYDRQANDSWVGHIHFCKPETYEGKPESYETQNFESMMEIVDPGPLDI